MARPEIPLNPEHIEQIQKLAGYGMTEAAIAHIIGVSPSTFYRRKKLLPEVVTALAAGKAKAELQVGEALFTKAVGGDFQSIKWWEMTRAGRSEQSKVTTVSGEIPVERE